MKANALFPSRVLSRSRQVQVGNNTVVKPASQLTMVRDLPLRNKDGNVHYTPAYSFFPKSIQELVGAIQFVKQSGKRLNVLSQGYSGSNMAPIADVLVYLQDLKRVGVDQSDQDQAILILETGATLKDIERLLASTAFSLPLHFKVGQRRLGDKAATSVYECICSNPQSLQLIDWIEKVDVNGKVRRMDVATDGKSVWYEASQLINKSGIVYRMGLKLEK